MVFYSLKNKILRFLSSLIGSLPQHSEKLGIFQRRWALSLVGNALAFPTRGRS